MLPAPFPKTRKRKLAAHLIGVPLDDQCANVCVVLWQSVYWKDLILLGLTDVRMPLGEYPARIERLTSLIYTGANVIRNGFWHLGPEISASIPDEISTRIIADKVWCDDTSIRPVIDDDRRSIPTMGCAGMGLVEHYIRVLHGNEDESKFSRSNRKIMDSVLAQWPVTFHEPDAV